MAIWLKMKIPQFAFRLLVYVCWKLIFWWGEIENNFTAGSLITIFVAKMEFIALARMHGP